jgi:glyoxylase-like metal-dependent hydrolase (beta-lactamase superfamily II)
MKPHLFNANIADQNTYVFTNGSEAVVVDPGFNGETVQLFLSARKMAVTKVLLTHGHYDHIRDVRLLAKYHTFTLYIHIDDSAHLHDVKLSYAAHFGGSFQLAKDQAVVYLRDGDEIVFHDDVIKVLHTPGHTPGSVCYYLAPYLYSGDTLFRHSVGRTDLAGGSSKAMGESIAKLFRAVSKEAYVYPGHDKTSTMSEERENNPIVRTYMKHH